MSAVAVLNQPTTVITVEPSAGPFLTEADLADPVAGWLAAQAGSVVVAAEIDAGSGIADLVAGRLQHGADSSRGAFHDPFASAVLELARTPVLESELRRWAPIGWRSLRSRVLAPLLADGLLVREHREDDDVYVSRADPDDPFEQLVAVELKLRDWRRAVAQAGRYRLFAERSYVALPAMRINDNVVAEAVRNRVGVLAVGTDRSVRPACHPATAPALQPARRRWASEQLLRALQHPCSRPAGSPIV